MSNLFRISEELRSIYSQIEEMEGELTPELEEALNITQEDFINKISDYSELLKQLNADTYAIDVENKRLTTLKKSKENLIEKLKQKMADAISEFGSVSKTGTRYVDLGTTKISVRNTQKCEVNDDVVDVLGRKMNEFINGLDKNGLIGQINFEEDFLKDIGEGFDREDIANVNFTVKFTGNLLDICDNKDQELVKLLPKGLGDITYSVSKSNCTNVLKNIPLRVARMIPNKTISVK